MQDSTTVRVSRVTRDGLRALADQDGLTLDDALARLIRSERQRRLGEALAASELPDSDAAWLDLGAQTVVDASR